MRNSGWGSHASGGFGRGYQPFGPGLMGYYYSEGRGGYVDRATGEIVDPNIAIDWAIEKQNKEDGVSNDEGNGNNQELSDKILKSTGWEIVATDDLGNKGVMVTTNGKSTYYALPFYVFTGSYYNAAYFYGGIARFGGNPNDPYWLGEPSGQGGNDFQNINNPLGPYTSWTGVVGQAAGLSADAKRVNAVRDAARIARIDAQGAKVVGTIGKTASTIGWVGEGISIGVNAYNVYNNPTAGNWGRFGVSVVTAGLNFIPVVGPIISFGVSAVDASGGFDGFYNWLDE
jgi:hypothetical protein